MSLRRALLGLALAAGAALAAESGPPKNDDTYRAILAAAKEPNRDIRVRVAEAIGRMGKSEALDVIQQLAADPAPEVRAQALRAMKAFVTPKTPVKVTLTVPVEQDALRLAALSAASRVFFEQRNALLDEAFKSGTVAERALACEALALDTPARKRALLLPAAREGNELVRAAAIRALDDPNDAEAVKLLWAALPEKNGVNAFAVRAAAAGALGRFKLTAAALRAAATDEHFMVRREALAALAAAADTGALAIVQGRVTDPDYTVREAACRALGALTDKSSAPLLAERLGDEMTEVRDAANKSLLKLVPAEAWGALMPHIEHKDIDARRRVWRVLGEYVQPQTLEAAYAHLKDIDGVVAGQSVRILRVLGDRRLDEFIIATLKFTLSASAPSDPVAVECFRAAAEWKLLQPLPAANFALKEFITPPRMVPPPFACSPEMAAAAIRYLAVVDHRPAIGVMEASLALVINDAPLYNDLAAVLKKMTGKDYPPPPPPPPVYGTYFIDIDPPK
jgi:HEAT repeat protein